MSLGIVSADGGYGGSRVDAESPAGDVLWRSDFNEPSQVKLGPHGIPIKLKCIGKYFSNPTFQIW